MAKILVRSLAATGVAASAVGGYVALSGTSPTAMSASAARPVLDRAVSLPEVSGGEPLVTGVGEVTPSILSSVETFAQTAAAAVVGAIVAGRWIGPSTPAPK